MALVVASLTDPDPAAMAARSRATDADVVEARIDLLDRADVDAVHRLAKELARPALATVRTVADGGAFRGGDEARKDLLLAAVAAGFAYVDVERDAPFADEVLAQARARGCRAVLSWHDLRGTPSVAEAVLFLRDAARRGAWCAKLATRIAEPRDAATLVETAAAARALGVRVAVMGVNDAALRALAPALGSALVYASAGPRAASGQLPVDEVRRLHAALPPTAGPRTSLVALLGHPVAHSRSPAMQNAAFRAAGLDALYLPFDTPPADLERAVGMLRLPSFLGGNVTVPHKERAAGHVDVLAPSAEAVGAVNTLVNRDGRLEGHNTDGVGALRALEEAGVAVRGARVLVLGAGGSARGVAVALRDAGAVVAVSNRTAERAEALARAVGGESVPWTRRAEALAEASILVNCTTVGLHPGPPPIDARALGPRVAVLDAVYRPGGTELALEAAARGASVVPGESMLLHQGAAAFQLWTGAAAPLAAMRAALATSMEALP